MITDTIESEIVRRLLVNYRIEPDLVASQLPRPLRPQIVKGWAIGGVCFIRLGAIRPKHLPSGLGMTTENVAHRFAVEWEDDQGIHVGVYVPRRDTNSRITSVAGGRVFPGKYHLARFAVSDDISSIRIGVMSRDTSVRLSVLAHRGGPLGGSLFDSTSDAIDFFRRGSLSYSPGGTPGCLEGVRLAGVSWQAEPATVERMESSLFDDARQFPAGTSTLDSGLIMRNLPVRWSSEGSLTSTTTEQATMRSVASSGGV